ncbi:hypothetical protein ACWFPY_03910 [Nocardia fluminea]
MTTVIEAVDVDVPVSTAYNQGTQSETSAALAVHTRSDRRPRR